MKPILRAGFFTALLTTLSLWVFPVAAQINQVNGGDFGIVKGNNKGDLILYIKNIVNVFLGLVTVIAVIFIIYAGVQLIISQGEDDKMKTAKHTVLYAIIGLIIIGLAAALVNFTTDSFK